MARPWWKFLAIGLLVLASAAALRTPLSPALVHVEPNRIEPGEVTLAVTGYNTHFGLGTGVLLENAGERVCALVHVESPTRLQATVAVPAGFQAKLTDIVVHNPADGTLRLDRALYTPVTGGGVGDTGCPAPAGHTARAFAFPNRSILYESIRNLHFHVPMWFTMIALMAVSVWMSVKLLLGGSLHHDRAALAAVHTGLLFCGLGLVTGMLWARATWGAFWTSDVKLNGAAVTALIYLAYLVLRGAVSDAHQRARLAAIYNIFAFTMLVLFLFVVPRLNAIDSLHPGNGGNSPFSDLDLDNRLRMVFYPAVAGWVLLGLWMYDLRVRMMRIATRPGA